MQRVKMKRVNIILATYNGEKYIREQIESIICSGFINWKLWICDDGSSDKTDVMIEAFLQKYPDKIYYHHNVRNLGVTLNFLNGVKIAADYNHTNNHTIYDNHRNDYNPINDCPDDSKKLNFNSTEKDKYPDQNQEIEDYYMFCDQDDVWMPDKIERTLKLMKRVEKKYGKQVPAAVFTDAMVVDEQLQELHPSFYQQSKLNTKNTDLGHIMMENKLIGCTVMFNDALRKKLQVLPVHARFHDWWIAMIASAFGHISFLPEATLYYRQHQNNVVGNQNFISYVKDRFSSLQKQKETLHKIVVQAEEFYQIYHEALPEDKSTLVNTLAKLEYENWLKRKYLVVKYGYLKTGMIRNIGLLLLI